MKHCSHRFTEKNLSRRATLNLQTTHDATLSASVMSCHPEKRYRLIFGWIESWSETRTTNPALKQILSQQCVIHLSLSGQEFVEKKRSNLVVYPILMFVASFSAPNISAQQREDGHEWVDSRWSSDVSLTDEITSTHSWKITFKESIGEFWGCGWNQVEPERCRMFEADDDTNIKTPVLIKITEYMNTYEPSNVVNKHL